MLLLLLLLLNDISKGMLLLLLLLLLPTERGQVAIFDATNSTQDRRQKLVSKTWGMNRQMTVLGRGHRGTWGIVQDEGLSNAALHVVFYHEQCLVCSRSSIHEKDGECWLGESCYPCILDVVFACLACTRCQCVCGACLVHKHC